MPPSGEAVFSQSNQTKVLRPALFPLQNLFVAWDEIAWSGSAFYSTAQQ
jgi:hypothetical protein